MPPSRTEQRENFAMDVRVQLLEQDGDRLDVKIDALKRTLDKVLWALVGAAITFGTAALMLVINLGTR